ncbi:hypothetical protein EV215_1671 [Hypnocyclicus thermotrophus]|uniref:Lipoprotein n=1 Tax=Hypnocyclicus thermotrophus TaxID=1627895 RepID=A0AA46I586_9FUSO|nr:hypothetical protein [Hypnocyclicus thermotrophus]TDT68604.1 hypothetical protein EV215_1671 [Hypnocyclicus thermotrophus]
MKTLKIIILSILILFISCSNSSINKKIKKNKIEVVFNWDEKIYKVKLNNKNIIKNKVYYLKPDKYTISWIQTKINTELKISNKSEDTGTSFGVSFIINSKQLELIEDSYIDIVSSAKENASLKIYNKNIIKKDKEFDMLEYKEKEIKIIKRE